MKKLIVRSAVGIALLVVTTVLMLTVLYYVPNPGPTSPRVVVSVDRTLWNGLGLNQFTYIRALRQAGLRTEVVDYASPESDVRALLNDAAGLVLTGGGDVAAARYDGDSSVTLGVKPERDAFEFGLLERIESRGVPVLGLCRGAQLLNVHLGGTLGDMRADEPRFRVHRNIFRGHAVELEPRSQLADIYGERRLDRITTWHGQFVDEPGDGVRVTAFAPDGTPEGFEVPDAEFVIGVQWHAEMPPWDREQDALFEGFAAAIATTDVSGDD